MGGDRLADRSRLSSWCAARETGQPYDRVYALIWRLIEAAIGQESDRRRSGTVEVDEFYVASGHKGERESLPRPANPEAEPTRGRERGLRHGPGRGHADKDRPVVFVLRRAAPFAETDALAVTRSHEPSH